MKVNDIQLVRFEDLYTHDKDKAKAREEIKQKTEEYLQHNEIHEIQTGVSGVVGPKPFELKRRKS